MTRKEAALYLGLSVNRLARLAQVGGGPKFSKVGRTVRYRAEWLDAFMGAPVESAHEAREREKRRAEQAAA